MSHWDFCKVYEYVHDLWEFGAQSLEAHQLKGDQ
jgi:hypothetical protein